ncbi:hypothetical protein Hanom_Chr02g00171571 [Helianthus anomalus]
MQSSNKPDEADAHHQNNSRGDLKPWSIIRVEPKHVALVAAGQAGSRSGGGSATASQAGGGGGGAPRTGAEWAGSGVGSRGGGLRLRGASCH